MFKINIYIVTFIIINLYLQNSIIAYKAPLADPDIISSGYCYNGVPNFKVSTAFNIKYFQFGGFIEVRNEKRFNQALLPNHNWRGFAFLNGIFPIVKKGSLITGIEHESAHPTMGFHENNYYAYEKIYDNKYRKINL